MRSLTRFAEVALAAALLLMTGAVARAQSSEQAAARKKVIADLKARGSNASMDEDFARDIEEGIKAHREPWNPPSWD